MLGCIHVTFFNNNFSLTLASGQAYMHTSTNSGSSIPPTTWEAQLKPKQLFRIDANNSIASIIHLLN